MERFAVKRGLIKSMGGNAGLAKLATQYFDNIQVDADGVFKGSFGMLASLEASFGDDGKLVVEVIQIKGSALGEFLEQDGGRELCRALERLRNRSKISLAGACVSRLLSLPECTCD